MTQTPSRTPLKGGIDPSGMHAPDLDARAHQAPRACARPRRRRQSSSFARRVRANPLGAIGAAVGVGIVLGLVL